MSHSVQCVQCRPSCPPLEPPKRLCTRRLVPLSQLSALSSSSECLLRARTLSQAPSFDRLSEGPSCAAILPNAIRPDEISSPGRALAPHPAQRSEKIDSSFPRICSRACSIGYGPMPRASNPGISVSFSSVRSSMPCPSKGHRRGAAARRTERNCHRCFQACYAGAYANVIPTTLRRGRDRSSGSAAITNSRS
jgi:hypothetical protein